MEPIGNDRWHGAFEVTELGRWQYTVTAWIDRWASWQWELKRKLDAGQTDLSSELLEGAALAGAESLPSSRRSSRRTAPKQDRLGEASIMALELIVDRERARFGSWYELFPRSWGGFAGVEQQLPQLAELGFDVVYLPPIHPIGRTHRKGRNNTLEAAPGDPGSPWAIGGPEGGHNAVNPELGTLDDFDRLVAAARELGIDIALDFAIQCSPDHPWLDEHPDWFHRRPDGTLKYAENPPKRYQDIYNVNFDSEDWESLWLRSSMSSCSGSAAAFGLPRRQPAHEARRLLGMADPRGAVRASRRDLPLRGVHAPGDDVHAGQARLQPVLHKQTNWNEVEDET